MADKVTFENVVVAGDNIEPGLLIWRRYKYPSPGAVEMFYDVNPHIRHHLALSPYLPVGVPVLIPIIESVIKRRPSSGPSIRPFGEVE